MTGNPGTGGESPPEWWSPFRREMIFRREVPGQPERFHRDCNHCGHDFGRHKPGLTTDSGGTSCLDCPDGDCQPAGRVFCTRTPQCRPGEHSAACLPPADPADPELRLMRAIFGLCGLCDREDEHDHERDVSLRDRLQHGLRLRHRWFMWINYRTHWWNRIQWRRR